MEPIELIYEFLMNRGLSPALTRGRVYLNVGNGLFMFGVLSSLTLSAGRGYHSRGVEYYFRVQLEDPRSLDRLAEWMDHRWSSDSWSEDLLEGERKLTMSDSGESSGSTSSGL